MQAIILAAGMGKRLGDLTCDNTKCMIKVNGEILVERVLGQLTKFPLKKIVLVIGYEGQKLKSFVGNIWNGVPVEYVENEVYDQTNNIYSLWLAREYMEQDDTLLLESDLIFEDSVVEKMISDPYPNLAAVASYESWMDGTVITIGEDRRILNLLSKRSFQFRDVKSYYKTVNIYKFSKEFSISHFNPFLDAFTKAVGKNEYYEQVLKIIALLDEPNIKALPIGDSKWYEIDDVQDLDIAEVLFSEKDKKIDLYHKRYGGFWRFPELIDFCYLVNPFFPTKKLQDELGANLNVLLREYPSGMGVNQLLAAKYFELSKENITVGNGAAELINSLCRIGIGRVGLTLPTFEEYSNRLNEEDLELYIPNNRDYSYGIQDLIDFFDDKNIQSLVLINPDNPSGNFIDYQSLLKFVEWGQNKQIRIIVDESFVDFAKDGVNNSLLKDDILLRFDNLVVIKSISKSYGVPGLRLGVLATSNTSLLSKIHADVSIWNINSFAEFYMQIFGKYRKDYFVACSKFIEERERFESELRQISFLRVIPSQANYFLCEVTNGFNSSELAEVLLDRHNLLIKDCAGKRGFNGEHYIRLAVRSASDNNKMVTALKSLGV